MSPRYSLRRDRIFTISCLLYGANRWIIKPSTTTEFFHSSFNDLLCFPIWIPLLVALLAILRLRPENQPPRSYEILIPLVLWSWMFEAWFPETAAYDGFTIADHRDIIWYAVGALIGAIYWRWWEPD